MARDTIVSEEAGLASVVGKSGVGALCFWLESGWGQYKCRRLGCDLRQS